MLLLLLACRPFHPPPEPPAFTAAGELQHVEGEPELVVRAGSAFDPPGREGTAWAVAHRLADAAGVTVDVGRELVRFSGPVGAAAATWPQTPPARSCAEAAEDVFATRFWLGHPYGHAVWGRSSVLSTFTAAELDAFQARTYVRAASVGVGSVVVPTAFPSTLAPHPTPTVPPSSRGVALHVDGAEACMVFGTAGVGPASPQELALVHALREHFGDTRPLDPLVEPGFTVAVALPEGAAGEARVRRELTALAASPPFTAGSVAFTPAAGPLLGLRPYAGPLLSADGALARWLGEDSLRTVVVAPAGEYPADTDVLSYVELTR